MEITTYASANDGPTLPALKATLVYPTGKTNLPVLICLHGYHDNVAGLDGPVVSNLDRWARLGYFIIAPEMRGNNGSGGTWDDGGREIQDIYDAYQYVVTNYSASIVANRVSVLGFSGGGGYGYLLACRYPDLFQSVTSFFGISDWGTDPTYGWYQEQSDRRAGLETAIGGTPGAKPDEYASRYSKSVVAINHQGLLSMFHDADDSIVLVDQSQRVLAEYVSLGRGDHFYSETNSGSTYRWTHGYPNDSLNNLNHAEPFWKNGPKTRPIKTIATSGTLKVLGMLKTKLFTVYMNDGSYLNSGRSRFGTLVYDTVGNSYQVTNNSANYAVVSIYVNSTGFVATGVLSAGETFTFTPASIAYQGSTPVMWFNAASKKLLLSATVTAIADVTGGPQYQGYALSYDTGSDRPAYLATDLNSLPAIQFNLNGLIGAIRNDLLGIPKFTFISVGTGAVIRQRKDSTHMMQFTALSGGSDYTAFYNGSPNYGDNIDSAIYKVRKVIYDGTLTGNDNRLKKWIDKVSKNPLPDFVGTIPALTDNSSGSTFGIGSDLDGGFVNGKYAEFMIFTSVVSGTAQEDALKTKYAI